MTNEFLLVAIWEFVSFAAGAAIGMVLAVTVSIHLEKRPGTLQGSTLGDLVSGARHINGFTKRDAEALGPIARRDNSTAGR